MSKIPKAKLHFLPDDMGPLDFEWSDPPAPKPPSLSKMWKQWRKKGAALHRDWLREQHKRINPMRKIVAEDLRFIAIENQMEREAEYRRRDREETEKYLANVRAAIDAHVQQVLTRLQRRDEGGK
jgi:hypothetical protein